MKYENLKISLQSYGRRTGFAYVSDSYRPDLRRDSKYKQWKRILNKATLKAMTPKEKHILGVLLEFRAHSAKDAL